DHLFCVNGNGAGNLYYSANGGKDWSSPFSDLTGIGANYGGSWGNYVKVVASASGRPDQIDLYYASGSIVGKSTLTWNGGDFIWTPWKAVNIAHSDNHDLAFSQDGKTVYAATDGGLEKSTNGCVTWQ